MTFLGLVGKNLLRQRVRSVLTLVGIAVAITTVVALGAVTSGLRSTAQGFVRSGGAAFMVAQEGAADMSFSVLPESVVGELDAVPGVAAARGALLHITQAGSNAYFFLSGVDPAVLPEQGLELVEGSLLTGAPDEIVLGEGAAKDLGARVGDRVVVSGHEFTVAGIYRSPVLWEDGGGFAPLPTVQAIMNKPGSITLAWVVLEPGADAGAVEAAVKQAVPGVVTISSADDYSQVDQGFVIIDAANVAISLLAVLIGGIGVMNTMVMSVFERTREIGVLRAVGWSGRRVLRMVMIESVMLCLVAALLGSLIGVAVSRVVLLSPSVSGLIQLAYPSEIFVRAFVVAVAVGLLGALYPAVRAARLRTMEALRYE